MQLDFFTPQERVVVDIMRELDEAQVAPYLIAPTEGCGRVVRPTSRWGWDAQDETTAGPFGRLYYPEPRCRPRTAGELWGRAGRRRYWGRDSLSEDQKKRRERFTMAGLSKGSLVRLLISMSDRGVLDRILTSRRSSSWNSSTYVVYAYKRPDNPPCSQDA